RPLTAAVGVTDIITSRFPLPAHRSTWTTSHRRFHHGMSDRTNTTASAAKAILPSICAPTCPLSRFSESTQPRLEMSGENVTTVSRKTARTTTAKRPGALSARIGTLALTAALFSTVPAYSASASAEPIIVDTADDLADAFTDGGDIVLGAD